MQHIPLVLAKAEMVLATDVKRPNQPQGPPICGKGTPLTESLIERLAGMQVATIVVEGHPVAIEGEQTLEDQLGTLDRRFQRVAEDPLMMTIKELYRKQIIRAMTD
jgi:hypothetical protein